MVFPGQDVCPGQSPGTPGPRGWVKALLLLPRTPQGPCVFILHCALQIMQLVLRKAADSGV